tara:strand:+ start:645 stop:854 length:210 start_codon:yes stop_codon:yes gene_type:complete
MPNVRKPTTSRREKINKGAMDQATNRLKKGKDKGDFYKNFISKNEDDYASGGTVRLASGGPVVDSYDYS